MHHFTWLDKHDHTGGDFCALCDLVPSPTPFPLYILPFPCITRLTNNFCTYCTLHVCQELLEALYTSPSHPARQILLSPFYRWRNWGPERSSEVTESRFGYARIWCSPTHLYCLTQPSTHSYCSWTSREIQRLFEVFYFFTTKRGDLWYTAFHGSCCAYSKGSQSVHSEHIRPQGAVAPLFQPFSQQGHFPGSLMFCPHR